MDNQVELLKRRLERERLARKQAETIIEEKSRELYTKNQELLRLTAAEQQARQESELLRKALEAFTSSLNLNEVVVHLLDFLKELVPHDGCALYLFEGDTLHLQSLHRETKGGMVDGDRFDPPAWVSVMRKTNRLLLVSDTTLEADADRWELPPQTRSWIAVPLPVRGRMIGCLTLESRQPGVFTESLAGLTQALAGEAAIALENAKLFEEVERLSTTDSLTGLSNRRQFDHLARLEFERSLRYNLPLSAIMMDIDHFKRINDSFGHGAGDRVLMSLANLCRRELRVMDLAARYGGEEFCFLLPETTSNAARIQAERLCSAIAGLSFQEGDHSFSVTASFGVSELQIRETRFEKLLENSDQALYQAKREGRNRVVIWESEGPVEKVG